MDEISKAQSVGVSLELLHGESIGLQVGNERIIHVVRHHWRAVEDPQIGIGGSSNHCIAVGIVKSDYPVVASDGRSRELYFQLGVGTLGVARVRYGSALERTARSILVAGIDDLD